MIQLLKILRRIYTNNLLYKSSEYKEGFADCKQLVEIHASKQSGANEALHLRKLLWHSQRERKIEKRLHKLNTENAVQELEVKRALVRKQANQITKLNKRLEDRKDIAKKQREKIGKILNNGLIPEEEKLKRIENLLKSYNNGTTGTAGLEENPLELVWD